jgi:hypothetical protein
VGLQWGFYGRSGACWPGRSGSCGPPARRCETCFGSRCEWPGLLKRAAAKRVSGEHESVAPALRAAPIAGAAAAVITTSCSQQTGALDEIVDAG